MSYFWAGAPTVARQLRRRNLWVAKSRDWVTKGHLLTMLEWHARATRGWDTDTWCEGKFLAQWTDPETWQALHGAFGHFDAADSWQALFATMGLLRRLATETAAHLGYAYPAALDERGTQLVNALHAEDDSSQWLQSGISTHLFLRFKNRWQIHLGGAIIRGNGTAWSDGEGSG